MTSRYLNKNVVIDTDTHITYIGRLNQVTEKSLCLTDAAIIDMTVLTILLEKYLIELAEHGFSPSRRSIWINANKVLSISLLSDVIIP